MDWMNRKFRGRNLQVMANDVRTAEIAWCPGLKVCEKPHVLRTHFILSILRILSSCRILISCSAASSAGHRRVDALANG